MDSSLLKHRFPPVALENQVILRKFKFRCLTASLDKGISCNPGELSVKFETSRAKREGF